MSTKEILGLRTIVIDDHKLFANGLSSILESIGLKIVATFENGKDAMSYIRNNEIDLIFSDINMPEMNGIQLCKQLKEEKITTKVIIVSMYEDANIIKEVFTNGANAYVSKNTDKKEIITAIKNCLKEKKYVHKKLVTNKQKILENQDDFILQYKLTLREREILQLILQEKSNQEISTLLVISKRTVETHKKNTFLKLGVKNNIGLAKIAIKNKLFEI